MAPRARRRAAIAGAGVFGLSSALALRARGWEIDVFDPGRIPRPEAASTDISKIVRLDYGADQLTTELMEEALPRWRAWNARWGAELFHETGFLLLSRTPLAPGGFEHDSLVTLERRGHRLERLDARAIERRFPAWREGGYVDGYFNPAGGWAESARVVEKLAGEARGAGVVVREETALDEREADVVLVCVGAWTAKLLPHLAPAMWAVAQPVFHLKPADSAVWTPPDFPVWAADIASTGWYGFPANADGLVKVANHGPGRRVDPDDPRVVGAEDESRLRRFLDEHLPALADAPVARSKTCLYCDSFDGDFWIGADPTRPGRFVAAGDSGHGFKFAPVIGDVVADAIEGRENRYAARFAPRPIAGRSAEDARFGIS